MRLAKVVGWSLLWLSLLPVLLRFQEALGDWALLVWFVNVVVTPMVTSRWTAHGLARAKRLGEDLRAGVVEILESTPSDENQGDAHASRTVVEALPISGFVVTERGVPNEQWRLAPVRAVAGTVRTPWLDYFDGKTSIDRNMSRPMAEAERKEIQSICRRLLNVLIQGVIVVVFLMTLLLIVGSIFDGPDVHRISVIVTLLLLSPVLINHAPAWRLLWVLHQDLKEGKVIVVSAGEVSKAQGVPKSFEFLFSSRRLWSISGVPAPWRIVVGPRES